MNTFLIHYSHIIPVDKIPNILHIRIYVLLHHSSLNSESEENQRNHNHYYIRIVPVLLLTIILEHGDRNSRLMLHLLKIQKEKNEFDGKKRL